MHCVNHTKITLISISYCWSVSVTDRSVSIFIGYFWRQPW